MLQVFEGDTTNEQLVDDEVEFECPVVYVSESLRASESVSVWKDATPHGFVYRDYFIHVRQPRSESVRLHLFYYICLYSILFY